MADLIARALACLCALLLPARGKHRATPPSRRTRCPPRPHGPGTRCRSTGVRTPARRPTGGPSWTRSARYAPTCSPNPACARTTQSGVRRPNGCGHWRWRNAVSTWGRPSFTACTSAPVPARSVWRWERERRCLLPLQAADLRPCRRALRRAGERPRVDAVRLPRLRAPPRPRPPPRRDGPAELRLTRFPAPAPPGCPGRGFVVSGGGRGHRRPLGCEAGRPAGRRRGHVGAWPMSRS